MYCNQCGKAIPDDARLCPYCGKQVNGVFEQRRLTRPRLGRKVGGVCLGFARYLDADVTLVRVITLVAIIFTFPFALIAYVLAWIVMPEEPELLPPQAGSTVPSVQGER